MEEERHLYSPSPCTDSPLIWKLQILTYFFPLAKIRLDKDLCLLPEQTQGIINQSGEKTVKSMFLLKSSFSLPWRPPHSEAGIWSSMWTETGETMSWTLNLHLWHCTHRGLNKSPQNSHKIQDCLKSSTLHCCYPVLISNSAHVPEQPDFKCQLCSQDHIIWEKPIPPLQGVCIYIRIWSIPKTMRCFLGLTDYKELFPL